MKFYCKRTAPYWITLFLIFSRTSFTLGAPERTGKADRKTTQSTCGTALNKHHADSSEIHAKVKREAALESDTRIRYIELALIADKSVFAEFGSDVERTTAFLNELGGHINAIFVSLNIRILLAATVVWSDADRADLITNDIESSLNNFCAYRRSSEYRNVDAAILISGKDLSSAWSTTQTFGISYKSSICTTKLSCGLVLLNENSVLQTALNVAHQLGHLLGMDHDADDVCGDSYCIMSPYPSEENRTIRWSEQSTEAIQRSYRAHLDVCLGIPDVPETMYNPTEPTCGNGIVESPEQCDCGYPEVCVSTCCDPHTCKLLPRAHCDTGECCDTSTCRLKASGHVCREGEDHCDFTEFCDGISNVCPSDVRQRNGESCQNGEGYCFDGRCSSHANQCQKLWGTGPGLLQCFDINSNNGTDLGDCGQDSVTGTLKLCDKKDMLCGRLSCETYREKSETALGFATSHKKEKHIYKLDPSTGQLAGCTLAWFEFTAEVLDPGLSPNGAKCGDDEMCLNQQCVSAEEIRRTNCFHAHDCSTPTEEYDDNNGKLLLNSEVKPRLNALLSDVKHLAEDIDDIEHDIEQLIEELH